MTVDLYLKGFCAIWDLYNDRTVFSKSLKRGQGTASPSYDCKIITPRFKIDIEGEKKIDLFEVSTMEKDQVEFIAGESSIYDLKEYTMPIADREVLKI